MKVFKSVIIALIITVTSFSLLGCAQGESAYDIARRNGFSGTEKEWLESLKGERGENGLDGKDGADGQNFNLDYTMGDLYNDAVKNGYQGEFTDFVKEYASDSATDIIPVVNRGLFTTVNILAYYKDSSGETTSKTGGAGVIYSLDKENGDALIVTNFHVVYNGNALTDNKICDVIDLHLYGDFYYKHPITAEYVGGSADYDIALLSVKGSEEIKNSSILQADFGDSEGVRVGERIITIGNPDSDGMSVTTGIISVASETVTLNNALGTSVNMRVIRYDAAVNPGNSGGSLFNSSGKLIGIINAKLIKTKYENIGYAIPSNLVKLLVENIIANCYGVANESVIKPVLGIVVEAVDSEAEYDSENEIITSTDTVQIIELSERCIDKNLFRVGDVLLSVAHIKSGETLPSVKYTVTKLYTVSEMLLTVRQGDSLAITLLRSGTETTVKIDVVASYMSEVE